MDSHAIRVSALLREGVAAAKTGNLSSAQELFCQVTDMQPGNEDAWMWLAHLAGSPAEAARCWKQALGINPQQTTARAGLARLALREGISCARSGRKAEARQWLMTAAELESDNASVWLWLASLAETQTEAVSYICSLLEIDPTHPSAIAWLARQHLPAELCPFCFAGKAQQADHCADCGAVLSLADPAALLNNLRLSPEKMNLAFRRLQAMALSSDAAGIRIHLGLACLNLNRFDEGIRYLQEACRLRPDDESLCAETAGLKSWLESQRRLITSGQAGGAARVVLVVDDSPTIRKLVSLTLEKQGYQVLVAAGGLEAMNRLKEIVPDLILLDITMPHIDGYQLCRLIKGNEQLRDVPVVMLSGKDGLFDKARGKMVGAVEYMTKPFEPKQLVEMVNSCCKA